VWNILLAARNEGYGGTLTTMAVPEEPKLRALLAIPGTHAVAAVCRWANRHASSASSDANALRNSARASASTAGLSTPIRDTIRRYRAPLDRARVAPTADT
jgi:hypothetical protein